MKRKIFSVPGWRYFIIGLLNILLAIGLTVASLQYIQPRDCYRMCGTTENLPCPVGACSIGEQRAGWPVPVFVDYPGGGSPTNGWAVLGSEDPPLLGALIIDTLFYSLLLWLAFYFVQIIRGQMLPVKVPLITLSLLTFLTTCLWFVYFYLGMVGIDTGIGRGHVDSAQVDTPTATIYAQGFFPSVRIPLKEIVEKYGEPDYVRLNPEGPLETPVIEAALYWDSIRMSVKMPEIKGNIYKVNKATAVEMIIFIDEEQYLYLSEIPFGVEKKAWKGYGNYQP